MCARATQAGSNLDALARASGGEPLRPADSVWKFTHAAERPVPGYVEDELRNYLECGILCFGFARARCTGCGHGFVIAFSCKGRGVCPSCNGRHMAQTAAHRVDHVIPPVPVRQWGISVPKRLRGRRTTHGWLLRHSFKTPLARHLADCLGETAGPGGRGVSARVPELRRRYPADLLHHGARADSEDSHAPRRTARTAATLARSPAPLRTPAAGREWHGAKVPKSTTSKNTERQKALQPPASSCHSLPKWLSSPSRIENMCIFPRGNRRSSARATQHPTHRERRREPQEAAAGRIWPACSDPKRVG